MRSLLLSAVLAVAPATALGQSQGFLPGERSLTPINFPVFRAPAADAPATAPQQPAQGQPAPDAPQGQTPAAPPADAPRVETPPPATQAPAYEEPAAGRLVSGAPLEDPNVSVHIVQQKQFSDAGRHELSLYPAAVQANVKFTEHVGSALSYTYHLYENFGLQITPQYNWYTNESGFNRELIVKVREEAQAASSLLLTMGAVAGVEVTPFYGKFAFYDGLLGQFTFVVNGGVGAGVTRHQLRPELQGRAATYGDTGTKLLGSVGAGFRFLLGDRFAIRLEVRDLVYTARVDQVNGCTAGDLSAMNELVTAGATSLSGRVTVSPGCKLERFEGTDTRTGVNRVLDVPLAKALVEQPSSDALNNVGIYAGFAILF
jgi:outer membrane beta-barrel protein